MIIIECVACGQRQRNIFEILLNPTEIRLYLTFSDWFGFQIDRKRVNTIWFWFDLIRFVCVCEVLVFDYSIQDFHLSMNRLRAFQKDDFLLSWTVLNIWNRIFSCSEQLKQDFFPVLNIWNSNFFCLEPFANIWNDNFSCTEPFANSWNRIFFCLKSFANFWNRILSYLEQFAKKFREKVGYFKCKLNSVFYLILNVLCMCLYLMKSQHFIIKKYIV